MEGRPFGYTEERDRAFHDRNFLLRKEATEGILTEVLRAASSSKEIRILDAGCGDAPITGNFIDGRREIYGIDVSLSDMIHAREKGVLAVRADLTEGFPFSDSVFDFVIATEIIDTDRFLLEIKRVLKPGRILILSTPNLVSLRTRLGTLIGRLPAHVKYRIKEGNAGHIRGYNIGALRSQLQEHNFEILKLTTSGMAIPFVHIFIKIKRLPNFMLSLGEAIVVRAKNRK